MLTHLQRIVILGVMICTCTVTPCMADTHTDGVNANEYQVKAGFIFNFLKFISIPKDEWRDEEVYRIGVLGDNSVLKTMRRTLAGKELHGRQIVISAISSDEDLAKLCHVIFVPENYTKSSARLLKAIEGAPVLIVGEVSGFARKYGMIGFTVRNETLRLEINPYRAQSAGLVISGALSSLAVLVEDEK